MPPRISLDLGSLVLSILIARTKPLEMAQELIDLIKLYSESFHGHNGKMIHVDRLIYQLLLMLKIIVNSAYHLLRIDT